MTCVVYVSSLSDVSTIVHGVISSTFDALQRDTYRNTKRGTLKERCRDANQSGQVLDLLLLFVVV